MEHWLAYTIAFAIIGLSGIFASIFRKVKGKTKMEESALVSMLVLLFAPIFGLVAVVLPVLGISVPIAGVAFAFRRCLGHLPVGVILLLLGIALVVAALTSSEPWEGAEENEYSAWVADRRRNPCGPREALLLVGAFFLAGGGGMVVAGKFARRKE